MESERCDWDYLRTKAGVRIVSRTTPLGPVVHDCTVERSTLPKGGEDEVFQDKTLRRILRRGISFIAVNPEQDADAPVLLRRGVPKFFDVSPEVLQELRQECSSGICAVVSTEKANGENAQISRFQDWWVIASKNVCLIARSAADVELYTEARYRFATEIGRIFFAMLERMSDNAQRAEFEKCCRYNTLVGELTGFTQHFVRYDKRDIMFFAVVPKCGRFTCRSPMDAILRLKSFGLPVIQVKLRVGHFEEVVGVNEPVFSENSEGCVSYVVVRGNVVGMYKVKTRRYQLLRKLRAKSKRFATGGVQDDAMMAEFRQEFAESDDKALRQELEDVARRMFAYISSEGMSTEEVDSRFLDVLDKAKISPQTDECPVCVIVLCPPFLDARVQKCKDETAAKTLINAGKDAVIVFHSPMLAHHFIASKRTLRRGRCHIAIVRTGWCEDGIQESLRIASRKRTVDGMPRQVPYGEEINFEEIRKNALAQAPRMVEVILAVGLPGMGKSTLLRKLGVPIVSSDAIVAGLSGSYDKRRPLAREAFNNAWRQHMRTNEAFALDKNFDPASLQTTLREIHQESALNGRRVRIRIFLFVESTNFQQPLWSNACASECATRLVHRTDHETLSATDADNQLSAIRVLLSFYALWKDWSSQRLGAEIMKEFRGTIVFHHVSAPPPLSAASAPVKALTKLLDEWTPWSKQPVVEVLPLPKPQVSPPLPQLAILINTSAIDYLALTFSSDVVVTLQRLAKQLLGDCTLPEAFHCTLYHHKQKIISVGSADYSVYFDAPIRLIPRGIAIIPVVVFAGESELQRGHVTLGWVDPWKAKHGSLLENIAPGEKVQTHMGAFAVEEVPFEPLQHEKKSATLQPFEKK
eukprot:GEMP01011169.1.p1 GENE.GEMP01011169.1~~GEMP01011169.1.p1  ORF type:complete len:867 (+),score=182.77 GEMP01011169.1:31-2631(+)